MTPERTQAERDAWRRKDYKRHGHTTYPSAVPCEVCGAWRRWVDTGGCVVCTQPKTPKRKR